uniref:Uncharacterized protein n=1 Tax=Brassica campestris TaxID=3711 RepID=A0A3P6BT07_BRACM|nr:unnamed protein product [Brassica rapa]
MSHLLRRLRLSLRISYLHLLLRNLTTSCRCFSYY